MSVPVYNLRNKPGRSRMSELSSLNDSRLSVFQKVTSLLIPGNKPKTVKAIPEAPSFPTPSQSHHVSTISLDNAPVSNPVALLNHLSLLATFLFQSLSSCDGRSSRSPTTLRNLGGSFVAITCSLDVAGRHAIYFPYEIWLFLNMFRR